MLSGDRRHCKPRAKQSDKGENSYIGLLQASPLNNYITAIQKNRILNK
jgi:hypothetical protein